MRHKEFLRRLDEPRIVDAIRKAESATTGEIRLCVSRTSEPDALAAARRVFRELGMEKTRDRNGVLILVAPESQTFAIVGDDGIDAKCEPGFWTRIAERLGEDLRAGRVEEGLEEAIARVGDVLARHYPRDPGDTNELPDSVVTV